MSEEIFCETITALQGAILEAIKKPNVFPALLIIYATMDIVAALTRPKTQLDTSGPIFKSWIDRYMLPSSNLRCTSEDIWGARCGFLHTLSTQSKKSREGK